jgi:hypothetical protein
MWPSAGRRFRRHAGGPLRIGRWVPAGREPVGREPPGRDPAGRVPAQRHTGHSPDSRRGVGMADLAIGLAGIVHLHLVPAWRCRYLR